MRYVWENKRDRETERQRDRERQRESKRDPSKVCLFHELNGETNSKQSQPLKPLKPYVSIYIYIHIHQFKAVKKRVYDINTYL